MSRGLDL
jgi:alpha-tubulin suppressor-like RCC1 family protein